MVSKASDDLPLPLSPVITVSLLRGMLTLRFFRLCTRAPSTSMLSASPIGISLLMLRFSVCCAGNRHAPTPRDVNPAKVLQKPFAKPCCSAIASLFIPQTPSQCGCSVSINLKFKPPAARYWGKMRILRPFCILRYKGVIYCVIIL